MPTERTSEFDRRFTKDTTNDSNRAYAAMRRAAGAVGRTPVALSQPVALAEAAGDVSAAPTAHPGPYDTRTVRAASQPWFGRKA